MNRMKTFLVSMLLIAIVFAGCASGRDGSILTDQRMTPPAIQYVWVGEGTYFAYADGVWVADPDQNYQFLVRQNRFEDRWESLKIQNRTSPDYNGAAGAADQQHFFRVLYNPSDTEGNYTFTLETTYGNGTGMIDSRFENATMDFEAQGISSFAPYNRLRITQNYRYSEGRLEETVLLYKRTREGNELPFARIEERAILFSPQLDPGTP
jgi:hypothetical protein